MMNKVNLTALFLSVLFLGSLLIHTWGFFAFKKQSQVFKSLSIAAPHLKTLNEDLKLCKNLKNKERISPQDYFMDLKKHPLFSSNTQLSLEESFSKTLLKTNHPILFEYTQLPSLLEKIEGTEKSHQAKLYPRLSIFELSQSSSNPSFYELNFQVNFPNPEK